MVISTSIGFNLAALLTEEFNSAPEKNSVLSWIQIVTCVCFPLVGIFPIRKSRFFLYFHYRFPMTWSHAIHQLFALNFFITLAVINVMSVSLLYNELPSKTLRTDDSERIKRRGWIPGRKYYRSLDCYRVCAHKQSYLSTSQEISEEEEPRRLYII